MILCSQYAKTIHDDFTMVRHTILLKYFKDATIIDHHQRVQPEKCCGLPPSVYPLSPSISTSEVIDRLSAFGVHHLLEASVKIRLIKRVS